MNLTCSYNQRALSLTVMTTRPTYYVVVAVVFGCLWPVAQNLIIAPCFTYGCILISEENCLKASSQTVSLHKTEH